MKCPRCGHRDTRVVDSRLDKDERSVRRRRQCSTCSYRFSTVEEVLHEGSLVVKRDGRREPYDRAKLLAGIRKATEKRPIDVEQLEMLVSDVSHELMSEFDSEIPSEVIGARVMEKLRAIDKIAFVRFACVYKDFRDISELEQELSSLKP